MYARAEIADDLEILSDAELIRLVKRGHEDALRILLARHFDSLYRFCHHLTANREDAEDICQETMTRAITRVDSLQAESAFRSWLFSIARNLSVDSYRSKKRTCPMPDEEAMPLPLFADTPHDRVEISEEHQTVAQALGKLAASHQKVLMLREVDGLSYADIANRLNVSQSAVETLLFRARRRLREEYSKSAVPVIAVLDHVRELTGRLAGPFLSGPPAAKVAVTAVVIGSAVVSAPHVISPKHPHHHAAIWSHHQVRAPHRLASPPMHTASRGTHLIIRHHTGRTHAAGTIHRIHIVTPRVHHPARVRIAIRSRHRSPHRTVRRAPRHATVSTVRHEPVGPAAAPPPPPDAASRAAATGVKSRAGTPARPTAPEGKAAAAPVTPAGQGTTAGKPSARSSQGPEAGQPSAASPAQSTGKPSAASQASSSSQTVPPAAAPPSQGSAPTGTQKGKQGEGSATTSAQPAQPVTAPPAGKAHDQETSDPATQPAQAPKIITEPSGGSQAPPSGSGQGKQPASGQSNGHTDGNPVNVPTVAIPPSEQENSGHSGR